MPRFYEIQCLERSASFLALISQYTADMQSEGDLSKSNETGGTVDLFSNISEGSEREAIASFHASAMAQKHAQNCTRRFLVAGDSPAR